MGSGELLRPRRLRLERPLPGRGKHALGCLFAFPSRQTCRPIPLGFGRMARERRTLLRPYPQHLLQLQDPRFLRFARQPGHIEPLSLHPDPESGTNGQLSGQRRVPHLRIGFASHIGQLHLGDRHSQKHRCRPGLLQQPIELHGRYVYPRYQRHARPR